MSACIVTCTFLCCGRETNNSASAGLSLHITKESEVIGIWVIQYLKKILHCKIDKYPKKLKQSHNWRFQSLPSEESLLEQDPIEYVSAAYLKCILIFQEKFTFHYLYLK